jgi:hypothetical protein
MKSQALRLFKRSLVDTGSRMSHRSLHLAQLVVNYMRIGRWMREHGFQVPRRVKDRTEVFDVVAAMVRDEPVLYMEFGVFQGEATRYWSRALKHPGTLIHGFDSFEGLPEDFDAEGGDYHRGTFDVGGAMPKIDDPRVKFFKGWFDQVLPTYTVPEHKRLVLNIDADLYSSTVTVLSFLRPHIKAGTLIYFDDMSRPDHEPRAFHEFMEKTGLAFKLVAAEQSMNRAFFECLGPAAQARPTA